MKKLIIFLIGCFSCCFSNPFLIDIEDKTLVTDLDYVEIQGKLKKIDLLRVVDAFYPNDSSKEYSSKERFKYRMSVGMRATLVDPKKGLYSRIVFEKIGKGGNCCVVSYASYDRGYPEYLLDILAALKNTGFNGYFYGRIGGYPNPTGREIKYAATPYGFKIPMILEAFERGFEHVLWLDSACLPQENCAPVFHIIQRNGCFFVGGNNCYENGWASYFFPKAKQALMDLYHRNPLLDRQLSGSIFGLKKSAKRTKRFVQEYYKALELGTPFGAELSEMFVFAAIAGYVGYPAHCYIDPYSKQLPNPVYGYTAEDHPELTAEQRKGMFLYRQNVSAKVVSDENMP